MVNSNFINIINIIITKVYIIIIIILNMDYNLVIVELEEYQLMLIISYLNLIIIIIIKLNKDVIIDILVVCFNFLNKFVASFIVKDEGAISLFLHILIKT